jgi:hypothetical protein
MGRYRLEIEIADFDGQMLCEHGCIDAGSRPDTWWPADREGGGDDRDMPEIT